METTYRNTDLSTLVATLREQQRRKYDLIVTGSSIEAADDGRLKIDLPETILTEDGVTSFVPPVLPTFHMEGQIAAKLGIPVKYLRRLRDEDKLATWATNINCWFRDEPDKKHLIRCYDDGDPMTGRALLSDRYEIMDNLEVLIAGLQGIEAADVDAKVTQASLSDQTMRVRFQCPGVSVQAPGLLDGYVSPFGGARGTDNPTVFAGFELSNGEVGGAAMAITPILTVQVCDNGLRINAAKHRKVHTGLEKQVGWAADTEAANAELVRLTMRDAVKAFCSAGWAAEQVSMLEAQAGKPVEEAKPTVQRVGSKLSWSEQEQDAILEAFLTGGQRTSGGLMQAVTAVAQSAPTADRQADLEDSAMDVLALV